MATDTFGKTGIGAVGQSNWYGNMGCLCRASPASSGTVTSISVYIINATTNGRVALYSDKTGPLPDALLGESGSESCANGAWHTFTGLNIAVTAGQYYWLAWQQDANIPLVSYDTVTGGTKYVGFAYAAFPDPAGASSNLDREHSIYATYTVNASATVTLNKHWLW
jgi:hypothetical protein